MLDDPYVRRAISRIQRRSERQEDVDRLALTFVDPGFIDRLDNDNNQVLYGRRGTGKTHVLRILERSVRERPSRLALYVDLRLLGSSSIFEDSGRPLGVRVASLLKDLLVEVHGALVDAATDPDRDTPETAVEARRAGRRGQPLNPRGRARPHRRANGPPTSSADGDSVDHWGSSRASRPG